MQIFLVKNLHKKFAWKYLHKKNMQILFDEKICKFFLCKFFYANFFMRIFCKFMQNFSPVLGILKKMKKLKKNFNLTHHRVILKNLNICSISLKFLKFFKNFAIFCRKKFLQKIFMTKNFFLLRTFIFYFYIFIFYWKIWKISK